MNNKITILIVEDEETISSFISAVLNANDYRTITVKRGREAISQITSHCPDIVLLDLGLPDIDGLEVLKAIRKWSQVPFIIVSAHGREQEKVDALDLGADDYITKPFATSELLARIRTAIRHSNRMIVGDGGAVEVYKTGDLIIDFQKRQVLVGSKDVHLTQIEFKIVTLIAKHAGRVITYDQIIESIWGPYHTPKNNQILRVNMANIRRKIEDNPAQTQYILTEVGVGYRITES